MTTEAEEARGMAKRSLAKGNNQSMTYVGATECR